MFFSSTKGINTLISKGMLNSSCYYKKLTFSKHRFCRFKKFVSWSVFRDLKLTQMLLNFQTSCCNLKIRILGEKSCLDYFKRNYNVFKSKSPCILLNKNINVNKNDKKSKMGNPTYFFRETNLVL